MQISGRTRVGAHRREVAASAARVFENVLDWEHLPWLHRSSFSQIDLLRAGRHGWRARVGLAPAERPRSILLEVAIDRDAGRYVSRTLEGPGAGTEIWTQLTPRGERTGIEVAFFVPGVAAGGAAAVGAAFERLYARLWDEDEAMMVRRTRELARRAASVAPPVRLALGPRAALRAQLPLTLELGGERWRVVEIAGELFAHSTRCPHRLGPLEDAPVEDGCVRCPWHGRRFHVRTGESADGQRLHLAPAPRVLVDALGEVALVHGEPPAGPPVQEASRGA